MKIKNINSPNYNNKKRRLNSIKFIILHYTGMQSERVSIERLSSKSSKVSAHYLINRKGELVYWYASITKPTDTKVIKNIEKLILDK